MAGQMLNFGDLLVKIEVVKFHSRYCQKYKYKQHVTFTSVFLGRLSTIWHAFKEYALLFLLYIVW